jgi:hypothetical protein
VPGLSTQLAREGIQLQWDVSVLANVWAAENGQMLGGRALPVDIVVTQPLAPSRPAGAVIVKPGPGSFSGSIYAPDSLVRVLPRTMGFGAIGAGTVVLTGGEFLTSRWGTTFNLNSVIGRDVDVVLASGERLIAGTPAGTEPRRGVTITLLGWAESPVP